MNRILIVCTTTGKLVDTGFAMDPQLFEQFPEQTSPFLCPACGKEHHWKKADAVFEENPKES